MQLIDSLGNAVELGNLIGKGGEGNVFGVMGNSSMVAKIYHNVPLSEEQFCKLDWMVGKRTAALSKIAAWPEAILRDRHGNEPCGLLMPRIDKSRQLHELYGTTNRRLHFPEVRWHHLLLAARNLASAFHTLHEQGIVVGDVNQGNLMVNHNYQVRFIDCDSFQVIDGDRTFYCPVGTPHFTPPELQSRKLAGIVRTTDHDAFGLAVLIFHLVFVGRHPFAGRFRGEGDLLIEEAIAERRFAFSSHKEETMVDPPPYTLQLDDVSRRLGDLFEKAFRANGVSDPHRPTPKNWVQELDELMSSRAACDLDDMHMFYSGLKACPWCRIEEEGGPAFFVGDTTGSLAADGRLEMLDAKVNALRPIEFPDLPPSQLTPPESVAIKDTGERKKIELPDVAVFLQIVALLTCFGGIAYWTPYVIGSLLALGAGGFLLFSKPGKGRRAKLADYDRKLAQLRNQMLKMADKTSKKYQQRNKQFDANMAEVRNTVKRYYSEGDELKELLKQQTGAHKNNYLRGFIIRDHIADIPGITASMVPMLESYGVETALDVHKVGVYGVPRLSPEAAIELLQWRTLIEQQFEFKPEHGVTTQDLEKANHAATQQFKISQARKILIGARHLESLALVCKSALKKSGREFEKYTSKWKEIARERGTYQQSRFKLERLMNSSPNVIITVSMAIPVIGWFVSVIFG